MKDYRLLFLRVKKAFVEGLRLQGTRDCLFIPKACKGQSFRGHRENIDDIYNGNFLSEVELLAEFDPIMNELINKPKDSIKYLSLIVQNELITVLSEHLENQIMEEIKSAMIRYDPLCSIR